MADNLGTAVLKVVADISGFMSGLKQGATSLKDFGEGVRRLGSELTTMGRQLVTIGASMAAALAPVVLIGAEFEETMSSVKAVTIDSMRSIATETNTVGDQFQAMKDRARELGESTTYAATEVATAMKFMGQAGLTSSEIMAGVGDTLDLAKAGMLDLGLAADIVTDIMSAFGLQATDIGRIGDNLAQAARSSNTSVQQLGEAFKFAAPIAGALGQDIEDVSSALAVLAQRKSFSRIIDSWMMT